MSLFIKNLTRNTHLRRNISRNFITLTAEQMEIKNLADKFARDKFLPNAASWDKNKLFPRKELKDAAKLGFGAIVVDPQYGGSGMSRLESSIIFESLSYGCVSTTAYLTIHNMCAWILDKYGTIEQKELWLPSISNMSLMTSYCLTEPGSGSDAASLSTSAIKNPFDDRQYLLNGTKAFISGGGNSDLYFVMAKAPKGITCFLVPKDSPGLSFGKQEEKMGWNSQPTSLVIFEDCVVSKENIIGTLGKGFSIAMSALDGGRINIASCSLGGAAMCLDEAVNYTKEREQFGKPLINNQGVQFELANMKTDLICSQLMTRNAASILDDDSVEHVSQYSAMAKMFVTDKAFEICDKSLQLHGGYGYVRDYPIERVFRDLRVHRILEGTNEIMKVIISRNL